MLTWKERVKCTQVKPLAVVKQLSKHLHLKVAERELHNQQTTFERLRKAAYRMQSEAGAAATCKTQLPDSVVSPDTIVKVLLDYPRHAGVNQLG